tara:strand:- start:370 stop:522 length:153 start_codon:yes stop_codon:yes gene_type:complete
VPGYTIHATVTILKENISALDFAKQIRILEINNVGVSKPETAPEKVPKNS